MQRSDMEANKLQSLTNQMRALFKRIIKKNEEILLSKMSKRITFS